MLGRRGTLPFLVGPPLVWLALFFLVPLVLIAAYSVRAGSGAVGPDDPHHDLPLFEGKRAVDGRATAYACRGYACDAPATDPGVLVEQVRALGALAKG